MQVILNVESLTPPLTGIGKYTLQLLRGLQASVEIDRVHCHAGAFWGEEQLQAYLDGEPVVADRRRPRLSPQIRRAVRAIPGSYALYAALRHWRLRKDMRSLKGAVYHEPNYILRSHDGPKVVTVHDFSHEHFPEYHPRERVKWLSRNLERSINRADRVITVSDYVRQELVSRFPACAAKTVAIHNGVSPQYRPRQEAETAGVLSKYGLTHGRYILSAATLEPRKNLLGLLRAYQALPEALRKQFPLVIAGGDGWRSGMLKQELEMARKTGAVRLPGYVPESDLPCLYSGAAVIGFISCYEGFGLPVAEGMASGVPVLTSARSAMSEVAAGAAMLVDPGDINAVTEQLMRLLEDRPLREQLVQLGRERSRQLTWSGCLEKTLSVYRATLTS